MRPLLASRGWPLAPQLALALALAGVLAALALGPANPEFNAGMYLVWGLWWALVPLSFVALGRVWCAVCPVTLAGDLAARAFPARPAFPPFVGRHATTLLVASFAAVHLANLWFQFEASRPATGALLAVLAAAALGLTLAFGDRRWCTALCPVGAMGSFLSRLSPLRIANGAAVCAAECGERACAGAAAGRALCPVGIDVRSGIDPGTCILCGACLKVCPRLGGVGWTSRDRPPPRPAAHESLAVLAFLGLAADMALTHLVDWPILFWKLTTALDVAAGAWTEIALHLGVVAAPPLLALALLPLGRAERTFGAHLAALASPALPLAGAGLLAVSLRPLLVEGPLQLQRLLLSAGWEGAVTLSVLWRLDGLPMRAMQETAVATGIVAALSAVVKRRDPRGASADGVGGRLKGAVFVAVAGAALLWICSRPMTG